MRCWGILKVSLNLFDILIEIWEDFVDNIVNFYETFAFSWLERLKLDFSLLNNFAYMSA